MPGMGMPNGPPGPLPGVPGMMGSAPGPAMNGSSPDITSKAAMAKNMGPPGLAPIAPIAMPQLLTFSLGDGKELSAANSKAAPGMPPLPGPLPMPPVATFPGAVGVVGKSSMPAPDGAAPFFSKQGPPGMPGGP